VAFAVFFALIFAAGHLIQEVRDHQGDAASGFRTNAVLAHASVRRLQARYRGLYAVVGLTIVAALWGAYPDARP
jgi:4-hydroxybenzoate polyprenyltransferase